MNIPKTDIEVELNKLKADGAKILGWWLEITERDPGACFESAVDAVKVTLGVLVRTYQLIPYRGTKVKEEEIRIALA